MITTPLSVGPIYIAAKTFRGERSEFHDIFIGFSRWLPIVGIALIIQLSVYIGMFPIGFAAAFIMTTTGYSGLSIVAILVFAIFFMIIAVYLGIRIYFSTLLCADPLGPNLGTIDSLKESWRITSDHTMTLFLASVLIGLMVFVSFLLLIIPGLIYGMPLTYAAVGGVYVFLAHRYGIIPITGYEHCPYCNYDLEGLDTCTYPECGSYVQCVVEDPFGPIRDVQRSDLMSMPLPTIPLVEPDEIDPD